MKIIYLLLFLIFSVSSFVSDLQLTLNFNSDSIWRGISQNDKEPTISSELDYMNNKGFMFGTWIENCCAKSKASSKSETGIYLGYFKSFKEIELQVIYKKFHYQNQKNLNLDELQFMFNFYNFELLLVNGINQSPNYYEFSYIVPVKIGQFNISYGDYDSPYVFPEENGSNLKFEYSTSVDTLSFSFAYFYFNSNGNSSLNEDGVYMTISKKINF